MADKNSPQKEPATEDVVEDVVEEKEDEVEKDNGSVEKSEKVENGKEKEEKNGSTNDAEVDTTESKIESDVCCIKRKSVGSDDVTDSVAKEDAAPEKKAKIDEVTEAESNGEPEVAA